MTNGDLNQIRGVVKEEVNTALEPVVKKLDTLWDQVEKVTVQLDEVKETVDSHTKSLERIEVKLENHTDGIKSLGNSSSS
ncbi:hypothetical protein A3C59_01940 [Candidatus Daviesbacteria bacterium RIFCSPHIGHO2_02_FULL_36_13]|uniref:Uncharacterized protein n=1 Tax=Candidatus Daviesbacteria bacterium RIFCSPHIGHO2_02_FULL_36_13 TaxID=1797768 RepID=A0A1F5JZA9_9BACT|nr:MAG: hypothetical protein A3C59_01940 [Candidatus Daviesbacteria bacterium RIFCSPHIGHO2_02_FULL_36_13]OGE44426.1 MAG: hypothetical protein A3A45_00360 [Candidatus Daviesbacteria bacterium RIFCSPLOWO2_01_FULL_36_8]